MSNRLVSIIIVTAGIKDYILACLESIKSQVYSSLEIIVIDNSLNIKVADKILHSYPSVKLYSGPANLSYCDSLNLGIKASKGEFILCLNDDAALDKRFIQEALKGFSIDEHIGMVSGKILRLDRHTIDSTGLYLSIFRTAQERGYGQKDRKQFEKAGYIFGVNGAVAFYRRQMLEKLKIDSEYFDSDFRLFYEDLDMAWRAQNFGWKAYYIPTAVAYHVRGASARQGKGLNKRFARRYLDKDLFFDLIKNRYLTIIKNEYILRFLLFLPYIIFYDFIAYAYIALFRPFLIKDLFLKTIPVKSAFRKRESLHNRQA